MLDNVLRKKTPNETRNKADIFENLTFEPLLCVSLSKYILQKIK